ILVVQMTERARRRQPEKRLVEALHAPALVIDRDEQRRLAHRVNLLDEPLELLAALEVALEQDHARDERRAQPFALVGVDRSPFEVDHQRAQGHWRLSSFHEITTGVRTGTRSNSSTISALRILMQPIELGTPIGASSGAP